MTATSGAPAPAAPRLARPLTRQSWLPRCRGRAPRSACRLSRKAGPPVHDDLVQRDFTADGPDRIWLTDITEHPTAEGKLYLCAIKDVWSGRITGYSMGSRMTAQLAVSALRNAIVLRSQWERW